jgi:hypothetical protein
MFQKHQKQVHKSLFDRLFLFRLVRPTSRLQLPRLSFSQELRDQHDFSNHLRNGYNAHKLFAAYSRLRQVRKTAQNTLSFTVTDFK